MSPQPQMDLTQILIMSFCGLVSVLFVIIGYFLKRILKQLDGMQTVTACEAKYKACGDIRSAMRETVELERKTLTDKLCDLTDGFDELCRCLTRYTEGKCP